MRTITHDLYDALTLWSTDARQWILEDTRWLGTYCVATPDDVPGDWHWQLVSPEELAARRDDLEDEQARLAEQASHDACAEATWQQIEAGEVRPVTLPEDAPIF